MFKKQLKIFLIATLTIFGVGALGLIIANSLASEPEKSIESDRQQFLGQFPESATNESAEELEKLALPLGLDLVKMPDEEEAAISESQKQAFEEIKEELDKYLDGAVAQTSERIEAPPEKLQRYLETNAATLEALSDYVLKEETPQWEIDTTWIATGDMSIPLPNWFGLLSLEKILVLDALQKSRQGRNEEAIARFAASWKIRQSLDGRPELIAQAVNAAVLRLQGGVLRQFEEVPPQWQQRLVERDVIGEMITAIEAEFLFVYGAINNSDYWELEGNEALFSNSPIGKTYARWSAIDTYHSSNSLLPVLEKSNACSFDSEAIAPSFQQPAWWNILGQVAQPNLSSSWKRAGRIMLELELTQKILQVKEMAAKEGKLPESLPNTESAVCPGYQWVYEVSGDKSSLSLTPTPSLGEDNKALPLVYYP